MGLVKDRTSTRKERANVDGGYADVYVDARIDSSRSWMGPKSSPNRLAAGDYGCSVQTHEQRMQS